MQEVWKDIIGYEGSYQVSNLGNVKSLDRKRWTSVNNSFSILKGKEIKKSFTKHGYLKVMLCKNGKEKNHFVHRLVAIAFINNHEKKLCVNHKNGIKTDNILENLEWCTYKENTFHSYYNGLQIPIKGSKCYNAKISESDVIFIRKSKLRVKELSKYFQIGVANIYAIKSRKIWKHLI